MNEKLRMCPTNDYTCPYFSLKHCACMMYAETGADPADECDDYASCMDEEDE